MLFGFLFSLLSMLALLSRKPSAGSVQLQVEVLYREYGYVLQRRCRRILRDDVLVDDAMQEIFLTLCRCVEQYQGDPQRILSWLYRITTTHCLQILDKDKRWLRYFSFAEDSSDVQEKADFSELGQEERMAVQRLMSQFSEEQRTAVIYRYVSGMTQEEIAEIMEVTRDQVRRWLEHFQQRGRIVLREKQR